MPTVDLSANELRILHDALEAFLDSGSNGNAGDDGCALAERIRRILVWGTGFHLVRWTDAARLDTEPRSTIRRTT
jgi:hypothetical protein